MKLTNTQLKQIIREEIQSILQSKKSVNEVSNLMQSSEAEKLAKQWADNGDISFSKFIVPKTAELHTGDDEYFRLNFDLRIPTSYDIQDIEDSFNFNNPAYQPGSAFSRGNVFIGDEEPEDGYYQAEVSITGGYDV